jgi:hypothetical protein
MQKGQRYHDVQPVCIPERGRDIMMWCFEGDPALDCLTKGVVGPREYPLAHVNHQDDPRDTTIIAY